MKKTDFDIVIVGGGLAGGLAALTLARLDLSVGLVDAVDPSAALNEAFDGRTTAIAYASARLFRRVGLWHDIQRYAEPILDIFVTDGGRGRRAVPKSVSLFDMHFDSRALDGDEPLGWIVENRVLRRAIYDHLQRSDRITMIAPVRQNGLEVGSARSTLILSDGRELTAKLVIAADGRGSPLRSAANINVQRWSYPQTGIVATVAHDEPHHGVAQEMFLPSGPFAILPMTEDRSSLVWTEAQAAAPAYLALDDDRFLQAIRERFGPYLGDVRLAGPRWSYPLGFHLSQTFVASRMVLLGDAARAIHPIAGQGYNLGVKDIAALYDILRDTLDVGLDIGHGAVLQRYDQWRRYDSTTLALGTDVLNRLFSNSVAPVRAARRLGLGLVNGAGPLRQSFMKQAGADLGDLPDLLAPLS